MSTKEEVKIKLPDIKSTEIGLDKFSLENLELMRQKFPGEDDETLARFLIARNNDFEKFFNIIPYGILCYMKENYMPMALTRKDIL